MSLCSRTDLDPGEGHSNLGYNSSHGGSSKAKKWIIANVDNNKKQEKMYSLCRKNVLFG